jgi:hypothetical protein
MITILSIERGFDENVGNEVLVPERELAADSFTFRAYSNIGSEKPMPANGAGTTAK